VTPAALDPAIEAQDINLVVPPRRDAEALEIREELPANLWRLPGFAKHWWPLYLDFHKKAGTPLSEDARAKFLAQLAREPLTAIAQIKRDITQAVRNGTPWTGLLEHAP
jgi:hypothetical protein